MRTTELKIINTDIPQLANSVDAKRLESLTGYPLAQLCAWDPEPRPQPGLDSTNNYGDDSSD